MRICMFNISKYRDSLRKLETRKAPNYVIEAYKEGYSDEVNMYYDIKLSRKLGKKFEEGLVVSKDKFYSIDTENRKFLSEAMNKRDEDFLKAFFVMANLNLISGDKLPPNAGKLLKRAKVKDLGLKDLFKKLR